MYSISNKPITKKNCQRFQLGAMNFYRFLLIHRITRFALGGLGGGEALFKGLQVLRCVTCKPWHCSADWWPGEASQPCMHAAKETDRQLNANNKFQSHSAGLRQDDTYHFDPDGRQVLLCLRGLLKTRLLGNERKVTD